MAKLSRFERQFGIPDDEPRFGQDNPSLPFSLKFPAQQRACPRARLLP